MNLTALTALHRRISGGSPARDTYQALAQAATEQLDLLQQPGDSEHRATALDAAARALAFCGDLAADALPRQARRSGEGHRYGAWLYQESRACRILASAEWARLSLDLYPDHADSQVHPIYPRDPLEDHPAVEPAFLQLCHQPDLARRALLIRQRLTPALLRHLPDAEDVLVIVAESYLQAVTNASATTYPSAAGSAPTWPVQTAAAGNAR